MTLRAPRPLARAFALAALAVPFAVSAQQPQVDSVAIRRFVTSAIRADRVPGLAIAVVSRDGVLYAEGFGSTGRDGDRITPDTPFLLGSMSKSITALAVMQLVDAGQVELDAPVRRYLADFALRGNGSDQITVRQLLAHTSGIPTSAPRATGAHRTLADHVTALRQVSLARAPGEAHEYSSPNYQTLGRLVEVVSGQEFGAYVAQHVFAPLGMRHSFSDSAGAYSAGLTHGHQMVFGWSMQRDLAFEADRLPTAALVSSAGDLGRFLRAELRGGELDGVRIASVDAMKQMHQPQVSSPGFAYAMGWRVSALAGETAVHHGGILPNYRGKMVMLPTLGLGVVVLTNVSSVLGTPTSHRVADGVAAILAGADPGQPRWSLSWLLSAVALGMLAITTLQLRGLLRARRTPRGLPAALKEFAFATALLVGMPLWLGFGWAEILRQMPDVGAWMLLSVTLGTATGVLHFLNAPRSDHRALPKSTAASAFTGNG